MKAAIRAILSQLPAPDTLAEAVALYKETETYVQNSVEPPDRATS